MSREHVNVEDEQNRIALACRTWPRSDLVILPLGKRSTRPAGSPPQIAVQPETDTEEVR
jgi:hypothetical protein